VVDVIAHRGAPMAAPENTVESFVSAVRLGADGIELDVRRAADGVLVVHHDASLPGGRPVSSVPAAELPPHVPTLRAALEACAGAWVNVEIKNDPSEPGFEADRRLADDTLAVLLDLDHPARWLVSSFDLATVDRVRELHESIPTAWLVVGVPDDAVAVLVDHRHDALHPFDGALTRAHVDALHAAAKAVNVWTCDDPARMAELVAWGVDGICTNVPDVALRVVRAAER
jgi:glycerophosphoryl diester phosphodiesterase